MGRQLGAWSLCAILGLCLAAGCSEETPSPSPGDDDPFAQVGSYIRELAHIECNAGCTCWEYSRAGESNELITISIRCECGAVHQSLDITVEEFAQHAEAALEWERRGAEGRSSEVVDSDDEI